MTKHSYGAGGITTALVVWVLAGSACSRDEPKRRDDPAPTVASAMAPPLAPAPELPELLYLPDGGDVAPPSAAVTVAPPPRGSGRCPEDMVDVSGRFCIDRYEATLVDARSERDLSPYYPPSRDLLQHVHAQWQKRWTNSATQAGRSLVPPIPPAWQLLQSFEPRAAARRGVVPNGYVSGVLAERACLKAGKRLCKIEEWSLACRGERGMKFPYGQSYVEGRCNVFRDAHPAKVLHGNASLNHLDPRLNLVEVGGEPLLRRTGATPDCRSTWGTDAIYDMVGNLDEWVDDPKGAFAGGFYSRGTREGCDSRITAHPPQYYDYSLGVRCCR